MVSIVWWMGNNLGIYFKFVLVGNSFGCSLVDFHGPFTQTILFFKLAVHEIECLAVFSRASVQCLLKQITRSLQFGPSLIIDDRG